MAANPTRLVDEIKFCDSITYTEIQCAALGSEINVLILIELL